MKLKDFTTDQLKAKLLAKTDIQESGCWIWTGPMLHQAYGQLRLNAKCAILAHRISYHVFRGPIPDGNFIVHTCGNRGCVNPDHLKLTTRRSPGRPTTLNEAQAKEIIRLWNTRPTVKSLAAQFNVTRKTIFNTLHTKTWKHLREPSPKPRISMADAVRTATKKPE